ncbi:hypothetical protein B0H19DRAFT_1067550 [Mycena capillaripes]|nr:hypothetical protein B0H19DRAFT_1067550 [Mycena capillaripes]
MPTLPSVTQTRLTKLTACFSATVETLEILSDSLNITFLNAISLTSRSLLSSIQVTARINPFFVAYSGQTVKQNKDDCCDLMERTHQLLHAIIALHMESDTGGELSPTALNHIATFTQTLHKIHHFVEAQQERSRIKQFFRQGEMNALLKECNTELQQALDLFHEYVQNRHREVLELISSLSDADSSDGTSTINRLLSSAESR